MRIGNAIAIARGDNAPADDPPVPPSRISAAVSAEHRGREVRVRRLRGIDVQATPSRCARAARPRRARPDRASDRAHRRCGHRDYARRQRVGRRSANRAVVHPRPHGQRPASRARRYFSAFSLSV
ncbi:MAG TPA: hypothetical protein VF824_00735 [Thermoanaerobaculia bacterium]